MTAAIHLAKYKKNPKLKHEGLFNSKPLALFLSEDVSQWYFGFSKRNSPARLGKLGKGKPPIFVSKPIMSEKKTSTIYHKIML